MRYRVSWHLVGESLNVEHVERFNDLATVRDFEAFMMTRPEVDCLKIDDFGSETA